MRQHPRLARASAKLAAAVDVVLDATGDGNEVELDDLWALIEAVASPVIPPVVTPPPVIPPVVTPGGAPIVTLPHVTVPVVAPPTVA